MVGGLSSFSQSIGGVVFITNVTKTASGLSGVVFSRRLRHSLGLQSYWRAPTWPSVSQFFILGDHDGSILPRFEASCLLC